MPAGIDPSTAAFWDFTWDDMAAYDIPALLAYVLAASGSQRLAYVGHSQASCAVLFMLLLAALAPAA